MRNLNNRKKDRKDGLEKLEKGIFGKITNLTTKFVKMFWYKSIKPYGYFPSPPEIIAPKKLPYKNWVWLQKFREFAQANKHDLNQYFDNFYKNLDKDSIKLAKTVWNRYIKILPAEECPYINRNGVFNKKELKEQARLIKTFSQDTAGFKLPDERPVFETGVFQYDCGFKKLAEYEKSYIKNGDFIDLGAYIGDSILVLDKYHPKRIFAFEIDNENFELFHKTMSLNNINAQIIPFKKGVGDKKETLRIYGDKTVCTLIRHDIPRYFQSNEVQCDALDNIVKEYGIKPRLIKMDVEGYELKAIKGAIETIKHYRPIMSISIYHTPEDFLFVKPLLESWNLGYKFWIENTNPFDPVYETVLIAIPVDLENK